MNTIISLLFFTSGVTGLVYEVLWAKYLSLFLGSTGHAHTAILAVFLGGLAVGNSIIGRLIDRRQHYLAFYGRLELGIGLLALASPWMLDQVGQLYVAMARPFGRSLWWLSTLRIIVSSLVIFLPAVLMGGTLPTLTRFCTRQLADLRYSLSWLYFLNSAGATFGPLLASAFLIPILGLDAAILTIACLNIGIGLIALKLARKTDSRAAGSLSVCREEDQERRPDDRGELKLTPRNTSLVYLVAFVSGMVSLLYEIAWIRLLSLVLGSSVHSFALMLSAFVGGIALGSWLINRGIFSKLSSFLALSVVELAIAFSVFVTLPLYQLLPVTFLNLRSLIAPTALGYDIFLVCQFLLCLALMVLPVTFIGMSLPLAARAVTEATSEIGRRVGGIYGINTAGNVLGAIIGGLFALPFLGLQGMIELGAALNLGAGILLIVVCPGLTRRIKLEGPCWVAAIVLLYFIGVGRWDKQLLTSGAFMAARPGGFTSPVRFRQLFANDRLLFYRDDANATVSVHELVEGDLLLKVNGKIDASSRGDLGTQILSAHIPLLLHSDPKRALIIGMGSGITAGAALRHSLFDLDLVEISEAVVQGAEFFKAFNYDVRQDRRLHLYLDDAKSYLQITPRLYDVIISEPSNPWIAGVGNLFTTDFYKLAKERLAEGGYMVQWFHTYSMSDDLVQLILRTFSSEFPYISFWSLMENDYLMIGSSRPITPDLESLQERLYQRDVLEDLKRLSIGNPVTLLSLQLGDQEMISRLKGEGRVNRDRLPLLEYSAPRALFIGNRSFLIAMADRRLLPQTGREHLLLSQYLSRSKEVSSAEFKDSFEFFRRYFSPVMVGRVVAWWGHTAPSDPQYLRSLIEYELDQGCLEEAGPALAQLLNNSPEDPDLLLLAARVAARKFATGQWFHGELEPAEALAYIAHAVQRGATPIKGLFRKAQLLYEIDRLKEAESTLSELRALMLKLAAADTKKKDEAELLWEIVQFSRKLQDPQTAKAALILLATGTQADSQQDAERARRWLKFFWPEETLPHSISDNSPQTNNPPADGFAEG